MRFSSGLLPFVLIDGSNGWIITDKLGRDYLFMMSTSAVSDRARGSKTHLLEKILREGKTVNE
jgi:hypothetical protein